MPELSDKAVYILMQKVITGAVVYCVALLLFKEKLSWMIVGERILGNSFNNVFGLEPNGDRPPWVE